MLKMPGDAIHLEAMVKSFRNLSVLTDVTLRVRVGEMVAIVGSNGAGKTTLLEILATLQLPTSGNATVGGFDLVSQAEQIKRIVGYCPAGAESFYPQLTGRANLEFFAALNGLSPHEATTRTRVVLEMMGASEVSEVVVQRCSAGMKQKLNLARALLADAPILLLDEPTRSLDAAARHAFYRLLRETLVGARNKTVLLVTHDPNEASAVCDRRAVLSGGAIAGGWAAVDWPRAVGAPLPARSAAG
jgi:ABC-type multidrug transport system ATPase subunit